MPHCPHCGNEMLEYAKFCPACGHAAAQPPPVPEPSGGRTSASLPLEKHFKDRMGLFLNYPGGFIGFFLIYLVIQIVLSFIPLVRPGCQLRGGTGPLHRGISLLLPSCSRVSAAQFSDFFLGFRFFVPLLLTALVGGGAHWHRFPVARHPRRLFAGLLPLRFFPWSSIAASISGLPSN